MKPQRICVIGNSGSGKSTLARLLGKKFDLPVYHLDKEMLHGQFDPHPLEEQIRRHNKIISSDRWIIDGSYKKLLPDRLARTDMVIYLNVPRWQVIPRTLRRVITKEKRMDVPQGANPRYSYALLKHQAGYNRRRKLRQLRELIQEQPDLKLVVLPNATPDEWLKIIDQQLEQI